MFAVQNAKIPQQIKVNQKIEGVKKAVRFHSRVKCRIVRSLLNEDHSRFWYSSKEYVTAREKERMLRNYARKTELTLGNLNAQGILTRQEFERKRTNSHRAKIAVLDEQEIQEIEFLAHRGNNSERRNFSLDDEKVVQAYYPYSQAALAQAQYRAFIHEMHIQAIQTLQKNCYLPYQSDDHGKILTAQYLHQGDLQQRENLDRR